MGEYLKHRPSCAPDTALSALCILSQPSPQLYAYTMTGQQMRKLWLRKAKPPRHHRSRTRLPTQTSGSKPHVLNGKFVFWWRIVSPLQICLRGFFASSLVASSSQSSFDFLPEFDQLEAQARYQMEES